MKLAVVRNFFEDRHATLAEKLAAAETELAAAQAAFDAAALALTDAEAGEDAKAIAGAAKAHAAAASRLEDAQRHVRTLQAAQRAAAIDSNRLAASEAEKREAARRKALAEALAEAPQMAAEVDQQIADIAANIGRISELADTVRTHARHGEVARSLDAAVASLNACFAFHMNRALGRGSAVFLDLSNPDGLWSHYVPGPGDLIKN